MSSRKAGRCRHVGARSVRPAARWLADKPHDGEQVIGGDRWLSMLDTAPDVVKQVDEAGVRRGQQRPSVRRLVGLNVEGDVLQPNHDWSALRLEPRVQYRMLQLLP